MDYNAEIIPFAHTDVAMNILKGVDPKIESAWFSQLDVFFSLLNEYIQKQGTEDQSDRLELLNEVSKIFNDHMGQLKSHLDKLKYDMISKPLLRGLASCNISELGLMMKHLSILLISE